MTGIKDLGPDNDEFSLEFEYHDGGTPFVETNAGRLSMRLIGTGETW